VLVEFAGAAQEVTGSCHLVRTAHGVVALDCGLFQGRRAESHAKNVALPLPPDSLAAVVLSHAHIDHAGRLPFLVAHGFRGPVFCTPATRDLSAVMLADSAHIQEKDAEYLSRHGRKFVGPLYTQRDVAQTVAQMSGIPYGRSFEVTGGVTASFTEAGHILGSASVQLDVKEDGGTRRLVFSGDIGRKGMPPTGADAVIMESTYGNRDHGSLDSARDALARIVKETASRGGRILIPAFAVGRTQEIVYDLHALLVGGQIPRIPVYIDSPLATDATSVFELHPDAFDQTEVGVQRLAHLFRDHDVHYTRDVRESKALNAAQGPMVIIAASGMAESGRILHHLAHGASDPRNTILIVGFQAEHTLGRRIVERAPLLRVFGEDVPLRAHVEVLNGYSAHADRVELRMWLDAVRQTSPNLRRVCLVHGEPLAQGALRDALAADGYDVDCPPRGAVRTL
jgi:metallo-beta-lactamase family protein